MGRNQRPQDEPHISIFFDCDESDPDCYAGPFFHVEIVGDELRAYRMALCDRTPYEVVARRAVIGDVQEGWAPVYGGETSAKEWFAELHIIMVCGKKLEHGFCMNLLGSEDCDHPVKRGCR